MTPPLVIVMPVYNEAACLADVVREWVEVLRSVYLANSLLLLIDDGSTDGTQDLTMELLRQHFPMIRVIRQDNRGHGAAVMLGYRMAVDRFGAQWVFQVDSDGQFPASAFSAFWEVARTSTRPKLLVGHRAVRHDPPVRLIITRVLRILLFLQFGVQIPDANCPYRLIEGRWLAHALPRVPLGAFAPNIFLSLLAAREGVLHSIEIPHVARQTGSVTINRRLLSVCVRNVLDLARFNRVERGRHKWSGYS